MKRENLIKTALGERQPDLIVRDAQVVNVFTGEILPADIAVTDGYIAGVGDFSAARATVEIRAEGRYIIPGMIDAHCHIESSMVTPPIYCAEMLQHGVTSLITDPHEIANVAGSDGIKFMLDSTENLPMNYYVQLPSCVPATPFENSGAVFTAENMKEFLAHPRVNGLGEMMNYPGVAGCDPEVMAKLSIFDGKVKDGHAPGITGNALQAYISAGMMTDHEATSWAEAREKLRAGLAVLVREGSACRNLEEIIKGVLAEGFDTWNLAFCTDDKHLSDIRRAGTLQYSVKAAIALGMKPVTAVQLATINAARIFRLYDVGAVAPGYKADFVMLDDLHEMSIVATYKDGVEYPYGAEIVLPVTSPTGDITHSVHLPKLSELSFALPERDSHPVINIIKGNVTTTASFVPAADVERLISDGTLRKIAVVERHHATGNVGVGLISGYGLTRGAVATTVAHDSHNLIVVGTSDADMLAAALELARVQGGYTIVRDGEALGTLPLPVAGLMTDAPAKQVISTLDSMLALANSVGVADGIDPFVTLSFMALPVIPDIRITDLGVFDVTKFAFI